MRIVEVQSNTEAYIIIKDMIIPPFSEEKGEIDVDDLLLSELKALDSLIVRGNAIVEESDAEYIKTLIKSFSPGGGGGVDPSELLKKEDKINKVKEINASNEDSDILYPSIKAVKTLVDSIPGGGGDVNIDEVEVTEVLQGDSLPFSVTKESRYLLGNPDTWVSIGGYIVPSFKKQRLEG